MLTYHLDPLSNPVNPKLSTGFGNKASAKIVIFLYSNTVFRQKMSNFAIILPFFGYIDINVTQFLTLII